jgi:hypothetical protein
LGGFLAAAITVSAACGQLSLEELKGDPLSPDAHRRDIVAIDAILFEQGALQQSDRKALEAHIISLSQAAAADPANTIAVALSRDLKRLASMAANDKVAAPIASSQLTWHWRRIRGGLFHDAWWFRQSSADPIEPAVPGPTPPSPLRPATADERKGLDLALLSFGMLIDLARSDLQNTYDSEPHLRFVTDARRELAVDLERLGPEPPAWGIDIIYKDAYRHAAEAHRELTMLTGLTVGAPQSSREYLVNKAEENYRRAREYAAQLR